MLLTLDSSVIIASLREQESKHKECKKVMESIANGKHIVVTPYTVFVEVVSAIRRSTGSRNIAENVSANLENMDTIYFIELIKSSAKEAVAISAETGLKGMDSIVVQIAKENNSYLVTLDDEMERLAKKVCKIKSTNDF